MNDASLLNAIIDNAIDGLINISNRGIMRSINPSASKLFSYTPEEVIGKNIKRLMPNPYHEEHDEYIARYQLPSVALKQQLYELGRAMFSQPATRKSGWIILP